MEFVNIGFGNLICVSRIVAVVSPDAAPIKRMVQEGKEAGTLIDATQGRKTKSVIFTDSDNIILSYLPLDKLEAKLNNSDGGVDNIE